MNIKLGVPQEIILSKRYYEQNRDFAIRDIFDALVELITNCDDSYHRLFKKQKRSEDGGPILIEVEHRNKMPSIIIVKDKAEGMTLEEMLKKVKIIGEKTSELGDRGFLSRGLKDCTALGDIFIESIVDDKYYKCELKKNPIQFIPLIDGDKANDALRGKLGIDKKNGTVVTIEISQDKKLPRCDNIIQTLSWHFALRDILSVDNSTKVQIKDLNKDSSKLEKIVYYSPESELMINEAFTVEGYKNAKCKLKIWKANMALDDSKGERFRKSGIIIKGNRAIFECTLFYSSFEKDEIAKKFFGRLDCPYLDDLMNEYDEKQKKGIIHPEENPSFIIDPNRQYGLRRDHPFTNALFKYPSEKLKFLIEEEKRNTQREQQKIINQETEKRLNDLAKEASKFLSDQVDEINELTKEGNIDDDALAKSGIIIYPKYFNIELEEIRTLCLYVKKSFISKPNTEVKTWSKDKDKLYILDMNPVLGQHPKKEDIYVCYFRVQGKKLSEGMVSIIAKCENLQPIEAYGKVVERRYVEHEFESLFEFEHKKYSIKLGSKKILKLFAKYPEIISNETNITVTSSDTESLPVRGICTISPVLGSNYAIGEVTIQARRLTKHSITIKALLHNIETSTKIKIVQKEDPKVNIKIDIVDKDLGNFRAAWADLDGKPNVLEISVRHDSIKRYLGPGPEFKGQNEPHFRLLLAELVAESICRKSLITYETKEHSWEFRWADMRDDSKIAADVIGHLQKRIRDFVSRAHKIMLSDSEMPKVN